MRERSETSKISRFYNILFQFLNILNLFSKKLIKSSTGKSNVQKGKSQAPVNTKGVSLPKSPFKFLIMTEKEKKGLELILKKAKISNSAFIAGYEERIFG